MHTPTISSAARFLSAAAMAFAVTISGFVSNGCNATVDCAVDGKTYQRGESFDASDGCNSCSCTEDGVSCTKANCVATCEHDGNVYELGDTFGASDGCNSCECTEGGVACTLLGCPEPVCDYNGQNYELGATFEAGDGCNTCSCIENGEVACTDMACPEPDCIYAGESYQEGESFPALDGCNTCECTASGIACTDIACACNPATEWYRDYVSTDPDECALIDYACPDNTVAFVNECGCGCEQNSECPEWFSCMPPAQCDVEQIEKDCPYSDIAY